MRRTIRARKLCDLFCFSFVALLLSSGLTSCEETCYDGKMNNNEEDVDCGGPCVPCDTTNGSCFDGIQNQGETGVDCGGPCNACITDTSILSPNFICQGTGGTDYLPLTVGSYWIYSMPSNGWFQLEITEIVTQNNGLEYAHMITTGAFSAHDYYRIENGAVYKWNTNTQAEELYIPANPVQGYQWTTTTADSIIVDAVNAALESQNGCQYENLLQITSYNSGTPSTSYYKQGLGLVQLSSVSAYLDSAVVY